MWRRRLGPDLAAGSPVGGVRQSPDEAGVYRASCDVAVRNSAATGATTSAGAPWSCPPCSTVCSPFGRSAVIRASVPRKKSGLAPDRHHEGRNADRSDEVVRDRALGHRRATACIFASLLIPSTISGGIPVAAKKCLVASARRSLRERRCCLLERPDSPPTPRRSIVVCPARAALATAGRAGRAVQRDGRSSRHQRPRRRCCRRRTVALEIAATRAVPTITARADVRAP